MSPPLLVAIDAYASHVQPAPMKRRKSIPKRCGARLAFVSLGLSLLALRVDERRVSRSIDIVVVTHNAEEVTHVGLASLKENTPWDKCELTIVDSGSTPEATNWLRSFCKPSFCFLIKLDDVGYTKAVNVGVSRGSNELVVVMNPDIIVYANWIKQLQDALLSCPSHGIVGPLSNSASFQSIPHVYSSNGSHAQNIMTSQERSHILRLVRDHTVKEYPRLTFINGFLFMMKRTVYRELDGFDETRFPVGYGEENDFAVRAQQLGYTIAMADDVFAYHFKTTAFTQNQRAHLSKLGSAANKAAHGEVYKTYLRYMRSRVPFAKTQRTIRNLLYPPRVSEVYLESFSKIIYVLPVKGKGGGVISIVQEAVQMRSMNAHASVAVLAEHFDFYTHSFPQTSEIFLAFSSISDLGRKCSDGSVVVATHFTSIRYVQKIVEINQELTPAYYIQDYEPYFFGPYQPQRREAELSYRAVSGIKMYAKTRWVAEKVEKLHGGRVEVITPSIDHELFTPASCKSDNRTIRISAMVRPSTPRRAAHSTVQLLRALKTHFGSKLEIYTFGCTAEALHALCQECVGDSNFFRHQGILDRKQVALLMQQMHYFVDMSTYQAFGRSLAECMASGCIPIGPQQGGASEFITESSGILIDTHNMDSAIRDVLALLAQPESARDLMSLNAVSDVAHMTVAAAAHDQLKIFFGAV